MSGSGTGAGAGFAPPTWLTGLVDRLPGIEPERFSRFLPPPEGGRRSSAVLILFAPGETDPDETTVVLTERAGTLRSHAGQAAFPGGGSDPEDVDAPATALREAWEEVGLEPDGVEVLAELPTLHIPVSGYDVTPVLAWWREPGEARLWARDPSEVERVVRPTVASLVDPGSRFRVRHPSGFVGPAWMVDDLLVWGFTAGLLDRVIELAGLARPWDHRRVRPIGE